MQGIMVRRGGKVDSAIFNMEYGQFGSAKRKLGVEI
jgi:hypothetical protein